MDRLQLYCRQSGETPPGRPGKNIPLSPAERFMTTVNKCNKQRRGTRLILITGVSVSDKEWHSILSNVQFEFLAKQNADMRRHAAAGSLAGLDDF